MTAHTPVYGLEYITEGEPLRDARLALENNALTIEAALIAGGIAPAGAPDIATLSGRVTALEATRAVASVRQSTASGVITASTWTAVTFQVADIDTHTMHSGSSFTRLTVPTGQGGTYRLAGGVIFAAIGATNTVNARLTKNGTALPNGAGGSVINTAATAAGLGARAAAPLVTLAAGDYIELQLFCSQAVQTAVFADGCCFLNAERIR